jgi:isopentenyldiphosphate isomerase
MPSNFAHNEASNTCGLISQLLIGVLFMKEEFVDILNEKGKKTGVRKTREHAHVKGLWHRAAQVWVYNSKGELLLQKRSMQVLTKPGLWDISAAGHVSAGETPKQSALRELYEEIGIKADPKDLKRVLIKRYIGSPKRGYLDKEFDYVYIFKHDLLPKNLQKEEVAAVRFVPMARFEKELRDPTTAKGIVPHDYVRELLLIVRKELVRHR